ncbi:hypothetical protein CLOSTMETH_03782 [[Clostridium] methylpentosum DSM 5476]|uniref:Uncharacterized protein n=1 Tax=[Clostridium] methylpentosum DSM 5476 TaxID=537013 RepID=C0EIT7_9FIRM|nr:hypothetical protein CLOSTMETH_03782 [[Clostridium] methylpentosum DSM 5476]
MPIPDFIFQICVPFKNHHGTFLFELSMNDDILIFGDMFTKIYR